MAKSPAAPKPSAVIVRLSLVYPLLIAYGSLFPFDWHWPLHWGNPLAYPWPRHDSRSDEVVNFLAYVPLGLLFALAWRRLGRLPAAVLALGAGIGLSFCMELLQEALPGRVTSIADIAHNAFGAAGGVLLAQFISVDSLSGAWLRRQRRRRALPGTLSTLVLLALVLWAVAELFPCLPSPDLSTIKHGIKPLIETALHPAAFSWWRAAGDLCELFGVGMLARTTLREPSLPAVSALLLGVALLKVVVVGQVLSLEFFVATLAAMLLLSLFGAQSQRGRAAVALTSILAMLVIDELRPGRGAWFAAFNWIPFAKQIGTLPGIEGLLIAIWIGLALATAVRMLTPPDRTRLGGTVGGACLFLIWFALEWHQQRVPGRVPDITDVLVGSAAWWMVWRIPTTRG